MHCQYFCLSHSTIVILIWILARLGWFWCDKVCNTLNEGLVVSSSVGCLLNKPLLVALLELLFSFLECNKWYELASSTDELGNSEQESKIEWLEKYQETVVFVKESGPGLEKSCVTGPCYIAKFQLFQATDMLDITDGRKNFRRLEQYVVLNWLAVLTVLKPCKVDDCVAEKGRKPADLMIIAVVWPAEMVKGLLNSLNRLKSDILSDFMINFSEIK